MRNVYLAATLSACFLAVLSVFAEKQEYSRYQTIVDRQMFGPLPSNFDPTKMPNEVSGSKSVEKELTKEQEQIKSAIHFSMVNVTPDGSTAVGFTDNSDPKVPVHYYLKVGEERGGWVVKEADAVAATMTIAKGDIEVSLELGANSAKGGGKTTKAGESGQAQVSRSSLFLNGGVGSGAGSAGNSLLSRRRRNYEARFEEERAKWKQERERLEQKANEAEEKRNREKAEQNEMLENVQRQLSDVKDALRKGDVKKTDENKESAGNETNDAQ